MAQVLRMFPGSFVVDGVEEADDDEPEEGEGEQSHQLPLF